MVRKSSALQLLVTAALSAVVTLGISRRLFHQSANTADVGPGEEVFAVDPGSVLELSFRSDRSRLLAFRWKTADPFDIVFAAADGRPLERCIVGKGFEEVLGGFTTIRVRRVLREPSLSAAGPRRQWAELFVRDNTELEPFRIELLASGESQEILGRIDQTIYVLETDRRLLDVVNAGCSALGK